jgi:hypothetical protein
MNMSAQKLWDFKVLAVAGSMPASDHDNPTPCRCMTAARRASDIWLFAPPIIQIT